MNTNHKKGRTGLKGMALAVLALLLTGASYAQGQELIRNIPELNDYSIIRQIDPDLWLVYSYNGGNKFYEVSSSGTSSPFKGLLENNLKICDFEIYEDMVYFCGTVLDKTQYAVMGYFPLDSFPKGPLYLDTVQRMISFDKLDVFSVSEQIHLVMTGRDTNGVGAMIDVMATAPQQWLYTVAYPEDDKYIFDDVAVTDNLVVFTSRTMDNPDKYGDTYLWYYDKPTGIGVNIFLYYFFTYHVNNEPMSPVLIEHMYDDWFAIACNSQEDNIAVGRYYGMIYDATFRYQALATRDTIWDIKYNLDDQDIDIVEATKVDGCIALWGICAHIEDSFFSSSGSTVNMHYPLGISVFSIDYLSGMSSFFIASGLDCDGIMLHVYRYKYYTWGDCSNSLSSWGEMADIGHATLFKECILNQFIHETKEKETSRGTLDTDTECESEITK